MLTGNHSVVPVQTRVVYQEMNLERLVVQTAQTAVQQAEVQIHIVVQVLLQTEQQIMTTIVVKIIQIINVPVHTG